MPADLAPERLAALLATRRLGRPCSFLPSCVSTSDEVRTRAAAGAAEGLLIVADAQTGGRGRLGRAWHSPPGENLYFSLLLRPALPARLAAPLTLLAGAALARTLAAAGAAPRLKWPNDLLLPAGPEMRKAAGSLTDAKPGMRRAAGGLTDAKPGMRRAAGSLTDAKPGMRRAAGSLTDAKPAMRRAAGSLADAEPGMRKAAGILTDAEPGMRKAAGSLTDAKPGMRKAAGILTEMACDGERVRHVVLGVGVDVNQRDFPPELRDRATSLALALGSHQDRGRLLAGFLGELEVLYDGFLAAGPAAALAEWRRFAALPQPCRVRDGDRTVEGTAVDVDDCGALLVRDAAGAVHSVLSGELHR